MINSYSFNLDDDDLKKQLEEFLKLLRDQLAFALKSVKDEDFAKIQTYTKEMKKILSDKLNYALISHNISLIEVFFSKIHL